jgi:glutaredoxin
MRWFAFIWRWLQGGAPRRPDLHIIVYTRSPCPLCNEAYSLLERFQARYGFILEAKNVDASNELKQAHGEWVPVVLINGKLRFRGHVNPVLLQRILDGEVERDEK